MQARRGWRGWSRAGRPTLQVTYNVIHPQFCIQHTDTTDTLYKREIALTLVAQWYREPSSVQEIKGSNPVIIHFFTICLFRLILSYTRIY